MIQAPDLPSYAEAVTEMAILRIRASISQPISLFTFG